METSSFAFNSYQYEPLPTPTSIRLLSLIPAEVNESNITICGQPLISCLLETVDSEHPPNYHALSYTWGSPRIYLHDEYNSTHRWPINVNGRLLYVTKNLHEALQHMPHWGRPDTEIDTRRPPWGKTLLIEAAEAGQADEVERLMLRGGSVHSQDMFGETALHYAAENGHLETVKILLRYGASKDIIDSTGRTPLACCRQRERGQWERVQEVLERHRPIRSKDSGDLSKLPKMWIDAICINQEDIAERNAQVMMMPQIYKNAAKVVVWLGVKIPNAIQVAQIMARRPQIGDLESLTEDEKTSIRNMARAHTWFQRKWVAQELALAQNVEMYCGEISFNWEIISHLLLFRDVMYTEVERAFLPARRLKHVKTGSLEWGGAVLAQLAFFTNSRWIAPALISTKLKMPAGLFDFLEEMCTIDVHPRPTLSQLIIMTWHLDATDPRDKIFALVGLASKTNPAGLIAVDYSKPIQQVFLEMGRIFIQPEHHLSDPKTPEFDFIRHSIILGPLEGLSFVQPAICAQYHMEKEESLCSSATNWPDLPTWVPNFDRSLISMIFYNPDFNACGSATFQLYDSDVRLLKIDAFLVDEVTMVEGLPPMTEGTWLKSFSEDLPHDHKGPNHMLCDPYSVASWFGMAMAMDPIYNTGEGRLEVLWQTLVAAQYNTSRRLAQHNSVSSAKDQLRQSFKWFICKELSPKHSGDSLDDTIADMLEALGETDEISLLPDQSDIATCRRDDPNIKSAHHLFSKVLALYVYTRALFLTEKGYLGNSFNTARPGDQVWLLAGARVPFLLRPVPGTTDRFELIGEAYLHGMMHGEAVPPVGGVEQFRKIEIQ